MSDLRFARRDKYVVPVLNGLMRLTSRRYQAWIKGSIVYGLEAAARDSAEVAIGHEPIAQVMRAALTKRGWRVVVPIAESQGAPPYECPNGHRFPNLWTALQHQIDRELRMLAQEITKEHGFEAEDDGRQDPRDPCPRDPNTPGQPLA